MIKTIDLWDIPSTVRQGGTVEKDKLYELVSMLNTEKIRDLVRERAFPGVDLDDDNLTSDDIFPDDD